MNIISQEEWLPIEGFPAYEVSNWGMVRSYWTKSYKLKSLLSNRPRKILRPFAANKRFVWRDRIFSAYGWENLPVQR